MSVEQLNERLDDVQQQGAVVSAEQKLRHTPQQLAGCIGSVISNGIKAELILSPNCPGHAEVAEILHALNPELVSAEFIESFRSTDAS